MGNSCSCFEGPCALASVPIPPPSTKISTLSPRLVSMPSSEHEEILSESVTQIKDDLKPQLLLDESLCDTSAVSQGAISPVSVTNSASTITEMNPIFHANKLPWLRDNQRIVSKLSRLSEQVPAHPLSGDSEDSHW